MIKHDLTRLTRFHNKISNLRFLDPACGCGNFLIITYRELRLLEFEVVKELQKLNIRFHQMDFLDISLFFKVNVDKFYGIEYEEFPARIAEVAMWLIDHQMNMYCSIETGKKLLRIPLMKSAKIINDDALAVDWDSLLSEYNTLEIDANDAEIIITSKVNEPDVKYGTVKLRVEHYKIVDEFSEIKPNTKFDYILGNPPFIGSRLMNKSQKESLIKVFDNTKNIGDLDYVTGWYIKAAQYIQNTKIKVAFVSTNSICQGLQTSIFWGLMLNKYGIKIHFAHRTFKWSNEAKGNAAVYCIIIGFANFDVSNKIIFDYQDIKGEAHEIKAKNINPYLVDAKDIFIERKQKPICRVPEMNFGNMPSDGGEFLFTDEEKEKFLKKEPNASPFFKELISAHEFLNGKKRWCLWLENIDPTTLRSLRLVKERVENVKKIREVSSRPQLANLPHLFAQITQPKDLDFILIPRHSSENRNYIPIGFFDKKFVGADSCLIIPNGTLFHFGVLMSAMHMAWVKHICGRIKSDYRYSKDIVYNNFPWPENPTDKQIKAIETAAQKVLDARAQFPNSSLADLYDPLTMPPALIKAHNELDKAVDLAYRPQPFTSEANRMVFLFELYEKYTADLFTKEKPKKTQLKK